MQHIWLTLGVVLSLWLAPADALAKAGPFTGAANVSGIHPPRTGRPTGIRSSRAFWGLACPQDSYLVYYTEQAAADINYALFRSVETRRPQVRAATSGISALISVTGDRWATGRAFEADILRGSLPVGLEGGSPMRHGGPRVWPWVGLVGAAVLFWRHR